MLDRNSPSPAATEKPTTSADTAELDRELSAAFLASGIGTLTLGFTVLITEMKATAAAAQNALNWLKPVGPLSGKTTVAVIAFLLSWVVLHYAFRNRQVDLSTAFKTSLVLLILGLLFTFPPVFDLFAK